MYHYCHYQFHILIKINILCDIVGGWGHVEKRRDTFMATANVSINIWADHQFIVDQVEKLRVADSTAKRVEVLSFTK